MVLKVTHLKTSGSAVGKYLEAGLDIDESESAAAYFSNQNSPTFWLGSLAEEQGLIGQVDSAILAQMLNGTLPTGEQIKTHPQRRLGEDFTFSSPKSVSIAALAWSDDRIVKAHDEAVKIALEFVQKSIIYARHGKDGLSREYAPSVAIACHRHIDSRPVTLPNGGVVVSPNLHSHCVIPNICKRSDGTLGGIKTDFGESSGLRLTADAIYQSALAEKLRSLGIGLRESPNGFELSDISDEMIQQWSPRSQQINHALEEQGLTRAHSSHAQRQKANLDTREHKGNYSAAELRAKWSETSHPANYSPPLLQPSGSNDLVVENVINDAEERLAVIPSALLRAKAILAGSAHFTADSIDDALQRNDQVIQLNDRQHLTTTTCVQNEAFIMESVRQSRKMPALLNASELDTWISKREAKQGFCYSNDQHRALAFLTQSRSRIMLGVGAAGSGKTTTMSALSEIANRHYEVIGLAPSHTSSQSLREATGRSQTLASWIANPTSSKRERLIILDEAGMISTHDFASLLRTLGPQDRLLCIGDPRQLGPISAGQPFYDLLKQNQHATLNQIRRQSEEEQRDMVSSFARGDARGGASRLMRFVEETEDFEDTLNRAADAYVDIVANGSVVALASRRKTANDLSLKIREKMQESGRLPADMGAIQSVEKVPLTRAAMKRKSTYSLGTHIKNTRGKIFKVEATPFVLDGQPTVLLVDDEGRRQSYQLNDLADENWQIVTITTLPIATGEQLLVTDTLNALGAEGTIKLRNGQTLTIQNISADNNIVATLSDGKSVKLNAKKPLPVSYGWAKTIHKSQGQTVDSAIVIDDEIAGGQLGYVAASRQKKSLQVFSPDIDDLESRLSAWVTRNSALDYKPTEAVDQQRYVNAVKNALLEVQQTQHTAATPQQPEPHHFQGMRP